MTGRQVILIVVFSVIAITMIGVYSITEEWKPTLIAFAALATITLASAFTVVWFNHNTASGTRTMKDWQSERQNGIEREIIITAEDGRQIFYYKGKVDAELDHQDNYIKFESEDGRRFIIVYGVQDTVEMIEVTDDAD